MPLQRDPATGKIQRDADTGKLVRSPAGDPCCCGSTASCPNCPDATPLEFTVDLLGITLASGCTPAGGFNYANIDQTDLSGTFILTRRDGDPLPDPDDSPGECVWEYGETPGVTVSAQGHTLSDCSDDPTEVYGFWIRLVRYSGFFSMAVWLGTRDFAFMDLFVSVSPGGENCNDAIDFGAADPSEYTNAHGSGGSASTHVSA